MDGLPIVEYFEHTYIGIDRVNSRHPNAFRVPSNFSPCFLECPWAIFVWFSNNHNRSGAFAFGPTTVAAQHFSSFHPNLYGWVALPIGLGGYACGGPSKEGS